MIESCPKCRSIKNTIQSVKLGYRIRYYVRCLACNYRGVEYIEEQEARHRQLHSLIPSLSTFTAYTVMFIMTKTYQRVYVQSKTEQKPKNRVSTLGGYGLDGSVDTKRSGTSLKVSPGYGAVGALQYQRLLNDEFSIGIQGQTNGTGMLMIGLDF